MATGIISVAFEEMVLPGIAEILFILNLAFYSALCFMLIMRILCFRQSLLADLGILRQTWPFLTFVVGTNTVGMQLVIFLQAGTLASLLWFLALADLFVCTGCIVLNLANVRERPLRDSIDGAALLTVVSMVSVVLLGARLIDPAGINASYAYFVIWAFWAIDFILYLFIAAWILHRLFFSRFQSSNWDASY